ncbi:MAG: phosphodiester glycosidase family protein [Janthinobacterium lividum]
MPVLVGFSPTPSLDARFTSYVVDPKQQHLQLFYQDDHGRRFGSIGRLQAWLAARHKTLAFALNGGMYSPGGAPKGLFIENQKTITPLDTASGAGNFYLKPNGVLYLTTSRQAGICPTRQFRASKHIAYATQSGPLLLVEGQLNPAFTQGSANVVVRNGVGILPGGKLLFAISSAPVNFYDFATYFKRLGCTQALYLDGFVSRLYLPAKHWQQTDGDFGVIIAVTTPAGP